MLTKNLKIKLQYTNLLFFFFLALLIFSYIKEHLHLIHALLTLAHALLLEQAEETHHHHTEEAVAG